MGLFERNIEPVFYKETSDSKKQLEQLQRLKNETMSKEAANKIEQEIRFVKAGISGEENIAFELKHSHMPMYILHDLYLEDGELSAQIDYLIVTKKLTFIIECKNLVGNIEINSKGDFIRTMNINGRNIKEGIYSPITQNVRHLELIKLLRGKRKTNVISKALFDKFFYDNYKTLVVLANPKTVLNDKYAKKEVKEQVIRADQLINYIKSANAASKIAAWSLSDMEDIAKSFLDMHLEKERDYTKKFSSLIDKEGTTDIAKEKKEIISTSKGENTVDKTSAPIKNNKESYPKPQEIVEGALCPRCSTGKLISRKGKFGSFLGCSSYPKCNYTMKVKV